MKTGDVKNFIYTPLLGLIEASDTPDDAIERINKAEAQKERTDKKMLRQLKRQNPNCDIRQFGSSWLITPKE